MAPRGPRRDNLGIPRVVFPRGEIPRPRPCYPVCRVSSRDGNEPAQAEN
jgi:hypothetical protein